MRELSAILGELEAARDLPVSILNDVRTWDATRRAELVAGAVRLFSHASPDVRSKSVWLLTSIEAGPEHTTALAACLRDPDESVRFGAARALVRQQSNALPALGALVAAFDDPSLPVRDSAGWAVSNIGSAAVPSLVELLAAPTFTTRATAAAVLGNIAAIPPRFKEAISAEAAAALLPPLMAAVSDPEPWVSFNAITSVRDITVRRFVPRLVEWLGAPDEHTRERAAVELLWLAPHIDDAVPALTTALNDPCDLVRRFASQALKRCGRSPAAPDV